MMGAVSEKGEGLWNKAREVPTVVVASERSKALWNEARMRLEENNIALFLLMLEWLRKEVAEQIWLAKKPVFEKRPVSDEDIKSYYRAIYADQEINKYSYLVSPQANQQYHRLVACLEKISRADSIEIKHPYEAIRFFLPYNSAMVGEISQTEKKAVDQFISLQDFMASLPAQLDQLSYRIQKKLAEDEGEVQLSSYIERLIATLRSSSSTNKLKEKRKRLDELRSDIFRQGLCRVGVEFENNLDEQLTKAIRSSALGQRRNWYDFFHQTPHTVVELKRIRYQLRFLRGEQSVREVEPVQSSKTGEHDGAIQLKRPLI